MNEPFPWQLKQWRYLLKVRQSARLPHAILLTGVSGDGQSQFAHAFAQALLCSSARADGVACGVCEGCVFFVAETHPDFHLVKPEEGGSAIKIDQVRDLIYFLNLKQQLTTLKVALIDPAEGMNRNAANALLKTLEEPPSASVLLLVACNPMLLPMTVRSRCQHIRFAAGPDNTKLEWLKVRLADPSVAPVLLRLANHSALTAFTLAGNEAGGLQARGAVLTDLERLESGSISSFAVAQCWAKLGFQPVSVWLLGLVEDLIRCRCAAPTNMLLNADLEGRLRTLAAKVAVTTLYGAYDRLQRYRIWVAQSPGIATLNLFEEFTMNWVSQNFA